MPPRSGGAEPAVGRSSSSSVSATPPDHPAGADAAVLEQIAAAVIVTDLAGTITGWNRQAELLYGWPAEEAMGRPVMEVLVDEAERDRAEDIIAGVRLGETWGGELPVRRKDGVRVVAFVTNSPLLDASGSPIGIIGVSVGITERKRTEQRLLVQHAVTRILSRPGSLEDIAPGLLEAVGQDLEWDAASVWRVDPDETTLRCLHVWHRPGAGLERFAELTERLTLARGKGLPGRAWERNEVTWVRDFGREGFPRSAAAALAGIHAGFAFPVEVRGEVLGVIEFFSSEVMDVDPELVAVMTATGSQLGQYLERTEAAQAVRDSEARKSAILESALDGIITMDARGRILEFNPAAEATFGYRSEDVVGRPLGETIIPENLRAFHQEGLARYVRTGQSVILGQRLELTGLRADGSEFPVEVAITRVGDSDPPVFTGYLRDITERRRAEQDRSELLARENEARTRAEEANSELQILQEVIEIALAHVSVDDLVLALLTRIRDTLNVDTATLLLWNDEETHLVVRATLGRDEAEAGALRIPRGEGLAGRIAEEGGPVVVDDLTQVEVHSEYLRKNIRSLLGVPLFVENRVIGVVHVGTRNPHAFSRHEVQVLKAVADRASLAIDHVRLYEAERAARADSEAARRRLQFLLEGSTLLSFSLDYPQALRQAARLAVGALADLCLIDVIDEQGKVRRMAAQHRDPAQEPKMRELRGRFAPDPDGPHPAVHVMKTGQSEFAPDMPDEFLRRTTRDEEHYRLVKELGFQSYMCVPLTARGRTLGTITLVSTDPERRFGPADVELAEDLARRAALAVDNARLYEAEARARARAEEAGERLAFLAEASNVLSGSLDYRKTLARVARLAVPRLADWCTVDMVEDDGSIRSLAVAHVDPAKVAMAHELREKYPTDPDAAYGVSNVIRTGQPELIPEIPDLLIEGTTHDPELTRVVKELQLRSIMTVPLRARGRNIGAITFIAAESGRTYGPENLSLATDLARRAAMAIDNARLFQERSYIARTLQQSLLPPDLPDIPGIQVAARYRPAGEGNEVGGDFYDVFDTGDGAWAAVIGDVCGKGAGAAAVMGVARHTVRAAAMQERRPSRILATLNDGLLRQTSEQRFLTVCYVRLWPDPGRARLTVASGGHPLPLVLRANGSLETAGRPGTLLGVFPDPQLHDVQVDLEAGDAIVMFTDGVTEEHGEDPGDIFGDERLSKVLLGSVGETAEGIVRRIEEAVRSFQPNELRDDLAVLALRVAP